MNALQLPTDRRDSEHGFTLVELIISVVLITMLTAGISAAFVTAINNTGSAKDRINASNSAQVIAAFLVRDAQAAGGVDPTNPAPSGDPTLGVSLTDPAGCAAATGTLEFRFKWRDWVTSTVSHLHVANYFYKTGTKELVRATCVDGGTAAVATLGTNITAVSPSCNPTAGCPGLPDSVSMTITGLSSLASGSPTTYTYTLRATVRPQGQAAPSGATTSLPTLLALGGSCPSTPGVTAGGSSTVVTVNGSTVVNGQTIPPTPGNPPCNLISTNPATFNATPAPVYPPGGLPDPFSTLPAPNDSTGQPFNETASCLNQPNQGPVAGHYSPGVYQRNLSITTTITFDPGVYFFCNGIDVSGHGVVTANGVLFYLAQGALNISGNNVQATLSGLAPPGPDAGFVIWMPRTNTATTMTLAGNSNVNQYSGLIYAPNAAVSFSGSADVQVGSIIARTINFSGNQRTHVGPYTPTVGAPNPTSGAVGTSVSISGSGFIVNSPITIKLGTTTATITAGATTDANGNVAATFTVPAVPTGSYTVSVADSGPNTATSGTQFTVLPNFGPATKLVFTQQPSNSSPNAAFTTQPQVTVQDASGNTVTNDASTVTLAITSGTPTSGGPGTLSGCTQSETLGVITFSGCKINTAGVGYKLHATDGALTAADSNAFNVAVGAASQFLVTPSTATPNAGSPFTVTLTAQDAAGNTAVAYTGSHTITWSGASTSPVGNAPSYPATTVNFVNGVSTTLLSATLFAAGNNTLTATSAAVSGSAIVTVQAGSSAGVVLSGITTSPSPALSVSGVVGTTLTYTSAGEPNNSGNVLTARVSIADSYGNAVNAASTQTIDLAITGSGSVVPTGLSVLTINSGSSATTATFTLTRTTGNGKTVTLTATLHGTAQKLKVTLSS